MKFRKRLRAILRIDVLPEADDELWEGICWYESVSLGLGKEFWDEFESVMNRIIDSPARWRAYFDVGMVHRLNLGRFPYCIIYEFDAAANRIVVLAVAHQEKMPGYWVNRSS